MRSTRRVLTLVLLCLAIVLTGMRIANAAPEPSLPSTSAPSSSSEPTASPSPTGLPSPTPDPVPSESAPAPATTDPAPSSSPASTEPQTVTLSGDQWQQVELALAVLVFFSVASFVASWRHGRGAA